MRRRPRRRLENKNHDKNWLKPLLVRSLSDGAAKSMKNHHNDKAMTLSLSESRLLKASSSLLDLKSDDTCSCGCAAEEELSVYSEDEGCFVITNGPQVGNIEVTNKVSIKDDNLLGGRKSVKKS